MKNLLLVFVKLVSLPPWVFASIYLLMIPSFAVAYRLLPAEDFYQGTSMYDQTFHGIEKKMFIVLEENLERWLKVMVQRENKIQADVVNIGKISLSQRHLEFETWINFTGIYDEFKEGTRVPSGKKVPSSDVQRIQWQIDLDELGIFDAGYYHIEARFVPSFYFKSKEQGVTHGYGADAFLSYSIQTPGEGYGSLEANIALDGGFLDVLRRWRKAQEGIIDPVDLGYWRFVYFSVVTITTLGYGDIVPLTNTARFLVAVESLFGVIFAGLFLNSTARRAR